MNQAIAAATLSTTPPAAAQNPAMIALGFVFLIAIFLIPGMVAFSRKHINAIPVALTGILFGWTIIGWGVALIWSFTAQSSVAVAATTTAAVAEKKADVKATGNPKTILYVGLTTGFVVLLLVLFSFFAKKPVDQLPSEPAVPPAKMGVPVPAEELFGE